MVSNPIGGGSSQPSNPDVALESVGLTAYGGTTVTSGSSNTKGSYASLGTTSNNWSGVWVCWTTASSSSARYLVDIRIGGSTVWIPDLYIAPSSAAVGPTGCLYLPLLLASGTAIDARCQSSVGSATLPISVVGVVASSATYPGFTTMTALNPDTTNTICGAAAIPIDNGWDEIVASTSTTYGSLLALVGRASTAPGTGAYAALVSVGTGAAASETAIIQGSAWMGSTAPYMVNQALPRRDKSIASGTRLSAKAAASSPGSDGLTVGLYGFS